jgi:DNA-binding ferritin-like protein (Dps family)
MGSNNEDSIDAGIGDGAENAVVGKRNTQNATTGNTVNINTPGYERFRQAPQESYDEYQRRINMELEREFRRNFSELTDALNKLSNTVALNNELTNRQVKLLEQQVADTREIARKAETAVMTSLTGMRIVPAPMRPQFPNWLVYLMTFLLIVIVFMGGWAMIRLSMGGM